MFKKITNACVNLVQRFLPDPFIFCIILTIVVFVAAMPLTSQGPLTMVMHWGGGVWVLLAFSMQMALVLVLGSAMANSPPM
ncbi:MAG: TIGR00366 family protein, partial [Treponema sp.]|nr:TIGR00366 family protein [Treponema sp.]